MSAPGMLHALVYLTKNLHHLHSSLQIFFWKRFYSLFEDQT